MHMDMHMDMDTDIHMDMHTRIPSFLVLMPHHWVVPLSAMTCNEVQGYPHKVCGLPANPAETKYKTRPRDMQMDGRACRPRHCRFSCGPESRYSVAGYCWGYQMSRYRFVVYSRGMELGYGVASAGGKPDHMVRVCESAAEGTTDLPMPHNHPHGMLPLSQWYFGWIVVGSKGTQRLDARALHTTQMPAMTRSHAHGFQRVQRPGLLSSRDFGDLR